MKAVPARGLLFCFDLESKPTLRPFNVPPALRARPHTGALGRKLLLLDFRCRALITETMPIEEKGSRGRGLPPPGSAQQGFGGSSFRFRAPAKGRSRRLGVTSVGGWLRSRSAACGRCSEAEQGQRSAFCKRATSRAAKAGHRNPDWVKIFPRLRSEPPATASAVRRSSYTEVCGAPRTSRACVQLAQILDQSSVSKAVRQARRSASCGRCSEACLAAEPSRCLRQKQARRSRGSRPNMQAGRVPRRIFGQRQPGAALQFSQGRCASRRENWLSARGKHSDRVQWTKQGAVLGAALRFLQAGAAPRRKNRLSARGQ